MVWHGAEATKGLDALGAEPMNMQAKLTRRQKENAIAAKFPPDMKRGRGDNRVIMVTGSVAEVLGVPDFTRFTMASGMSDDQIGLLFNFLFNRDGGGE